jgi:type I restriction enzyme R subunit
VFSFRYSISVISNAKVHQAYIHYFCGEDTTDKDGLKATEIRRITLYRLTVSLIRAYANLANELEAAGYSLTDIKTITDDVAHYEKVRTEIKLASGDYIDLKMYEPAMRHLIDTYIRAEDSVKISAFDDLTLIQLIVERGIDAAVNALPEDIAKNPGAVAETIENNLRRLIIDEHPTNPKYFDQMSRLLDTLIHERREKAEEYKVYLAKIADFTKRLTNPIARYPQSVKTSAQRALFDNLGQNETLALEIDTAIRHTKRDGWRGDRIKEKEVKLAIGRHISDDTLIEQIFALVKNQSEY